MEEQRQIPTRATRRTYPDTIANQASSGLFCGCTGSPTELVSHGDGVLKCPSCHELHTTGGQRLGKKDLPADNPLTF